MTCSGFGIFFVFFLLFVFWGLKKWQKKFKPVALVFSRLSDLTLPSPSIKVRLVQLPFYLYLITFILLCVCVLQLKFYVVEEEAISPLSNIQLEGEVKEISIPSQGLAMYLLLDRSGSMQEKIDIVTSKGKREYLTRMELLKLVTHQFIVGDPKLGLEGRGQDLLGIGAFARTMHILTPMTFDHQTALRSLRNLQVVTHREEDGTAIGYAVFKGAKMMDTTLYHMQSLSDQDKGSYEVLNKVMIVVTDGLNSPSSLDREHQWRNLSPTEAAKEVKKLGIRLYLINIEPAILKPQLKDLKQELQDAAEITGGRLFVLEEPNALLRVFQEIEKIEKSLLPVKQEVELVAAKPETLYQVYDLNHWLLGISFLLLFSGIILENSWLRRGI